MVSVNNGCGASGYTGLTVFPGYSCGGYYYSYYPNPTTEELTIEVMNQSDGKPLTNGIAVSFDSYIYDDKQTEVMHLVGKDNRAVFDLSGLKKGKYYLQIVDSHQVIREQVILK
jgi:hypothetical protein